MDAPERRLEEAIVARLAAGATGTLEAWADKKRWGFQFKEGALVSTRSNLKSEQEDALRRNLASATTGEILHAQTVRRLVNAGKEPGVVWGWREGEVTPAAEPIDVWRALFEAVRDLRGEDELRDMLGPVLGGAPRADRLVPPLGAGGALEVYLSHLDGARPMDDVLEFAPAEPRSVMIGLWLAWRMAWLDAGLTAATTTPAPTIEVTTTPRPAPVAPAPVAPAPAAPPPSTAAPGGKAGRGGGKGLDLSALIAEGISEASAPPPASPPTPPPRPSQPAAPVAEPPRSGLSPADRLAELAVQLKAAKHPWETLGLPWGAEPEAFRAAYMRLARDLHPDRFVGATEAQRDQATGLFDQVRAAWGLLGDEAQRTAYIDRHVHGKKSEDELALEAVQRFLGAETEFKRGQSMFRAGRIVESHPLFRGAHEKCPEEIEFRAWYGYTTFYLNHGRDDEAAAKGLSMLRQAVDDNGKQERKHDAIWLLLAKAQHQRGDALQARRTLVQVIKMNAANSDAVRLLRRIDEEQQAEANARKQADSLFGKVSGFFAGAFKKKPE